MNYNNKNAMLENSTYHSFNRNFIYLLLNAEVPKLKFCFFIWQQSVRFLLFIDEDFFFVVFFFIILCYFMVNPLFD